MTWSAEARRAAAAARRRKRPIHVGFSGTARGKGPSREQMKVVGELLTELRKSGAKVFHHGKAILADEQAHQLAKGRGYKIEVHPGDTPDKQSNVKGDLEHPPKGNIDRNQDIVDVSHAMIFTPRGFRYQPRSGTWSTIRRADKARKLSFIVYPDGTVDVKHG